MNQDDKKNLSSVIIAGIQISSSHVLSWDTQFSTVFLILNAWILAIKICYPSFT